MVSTNSPQRWAVQHFGQLQLNDKRLTRRVVRYAAAAAASPGKSIPEQCGGDWSRIKGAYRLFDNSKLSLDALQASDRRQTREAAASAGVVLWIHDTTTLSFAHPATQGLGPTSPSGGTGMLLQSTLAVDVSAGVDQAVVMGLGHQQLWVRPDKPASRRSELAKWELGIDAVAAAGSSARWVHVADSESDCWEAIEACRRHKVGFALRACQNRKVIAGHDAVDCLPEQAGLLFDLPRCPPELGKRKLRLRKRKDRPAHEALLSVSAMPLTLLPPTHWNRLEHRRDASRPQPVRCWAVRVHEVEAASGQEPIEWVILTDEPVLDLASALKVIGWYTCRWLIEEYHKSLKTGCAMEQRQLEHADRLENLLGILAIVAVRVLRAKHQARINPQAPAGSVVPRQYVQTLAAYLKRPANQLTIHEFTRETARLGGFIGRKNDGEPGWITLWRGWQRLELLTVGYQLARDTS